MSLVPIAILMGLPTVGALTAWWIGLKAWRAAGSQIPPGPEGREARGRVIPLVVLPSTLVVFGMVVSLLLLGESVPDAVAMPVALAYAVPGLLSGFGVAIIYREGILAAATSKRGFGRVMPLTVMPETGAVFGVLVSLLLIGGDSHPPGLLAFGMETTWLAAGLSMVGGVGGPVGAWLAASKWDFKTAEMWPKALPKSSGGGMFTAACFALAMAILGEWLIVLLLVLYFGSTLFVGLALFMRARRKRHNAMKPS